MMEEPKQRHSFFQVYVPSPSQSVSDTLKKRIIEDLLPEIANTLKDCKVDSNERHIQRDLNRKEILKKKENEKMKLLNQDKSQIMLDDKQKNNHLSSKPIEINEQESRNQIEDNKGSMEHIIIKENEQVQYPILKRKNIPPYVIGYNECVRQIQANNLRFMVLMSDVKPQYFLNDLILLAYNQNIPILSLRGCWRDFAAVCKLNRLLCFGVTKDTINNKSLKGTITFIENLIPPLNIPWIKKNLIK
ncbi:hypothetical protein WA158_000399 [Blastocystis sp. Blastoise]